jgi:hypothetical protein
MKYLKQAESWTRAKSFLRLYSLTSNGLNWNDVNIQFNEVGISVRIGSKLKFLEYSEHHVADIERVIDYLMCSGNENILLDPFKYLNSETHQTEAPAIKLADEPVDDDGNPYTIAFRSAIKTALLPPVIVDKEAHDELINSIVSIDQIYSFLMPQLETFKNYNAWFHAIPDNHMKEMESATNKLYEMSTQVIASNSIKYETTILLNEHLLSMNMYKRNPSLFKDSILNGMKIFYLLLKEKERGYFISDIKTISKNKLRYVWDMLNTEMFGDKNPIEFVYNYYTESIDTFNGFQWNEYNRTHAFEIYTKIGKTIPNHIEAFPFQIFTNNIPSLSTYPTTPFNWALTMYGCSHEGLDYDTCLHGAHFSGTEAIKSYTEVLLKYIQCPLKAFEEYVCYIERCHGNEDGIDVYDDFMDFLDECTGKGINNYLDSAIKHGYYAPQDDEPHETSIFKCDINRIHNVMRRFIQFIEDGRELYELYPNEMVFDDITIKLVPVEGTLLKQIKASIYNHNEESKITTEQKLRMLHGSELMNRTVEVPEPLKQYYMQYKKALVFAGKELGHCIGGKTDSKNLFFRNGTVCAEVSYNEERFTVTTCLDAKNQNTENAEAFRRLIEEVITGLVPVPIAVNS